MKPTFGKQKILIEKGRWSEIILWLVLIAMIVIFCSISKDFRTLRNLISISESIVTFGIMAVGATIILISGGLDLSIGSTLCLAAIAVATLSNLAIPSGLVIILALVIGTLVGLINGILIVWGKINSFIATLATMIIVRGLIYVFTNGLSRSFSSPLIAAIGKGRLFEIPIPIIITIFLYLIIYFFLEKTGFGSDVRAIGGNSEAARLVGINIRNYSLVLYMFSAFTASLAGVILAGRMLSAQPQMGTGYELQVIAAVVLGGVSLTMGGVGKLHGTIVGVLLLGILSNGLSMLNVGSFWQQIAKGTLFLVAVFFDSLRSRSYKKA